MISSAGTELPGHAEGGGAGGEATDCGAGVGGERRDGGSDDGDDAGDDGGGGGKGIGGDAQCGEDGSGEGGLLTTTPVPITSFGLFCLSSLRESNLTCV